MRPPEKRQRKNERATRQAKPFQRTCKHRPKTGTGDSGEGRQETPGSER